MVVWNRCHIRLPQQPHRQQQQRLTGSLSVSLSTKCWQTRCKLNCMNRPANVLKYVWSWLRCSFVSSMKRWNSVWPKPPLHFFITFSVMKSFWYDDIYTFDISHRNILCFWVLFVRHPVCKGLEIIVTWYKRNQGKRSGQYHLQRYSKFNMWLNTPPQS